MKGNKIDRKAWRCSICDCKADETAEASTVRNQFKANLCQKHYQQMLTKGEITDKSKSRRREPRVCDICQSTKKVMQVKKSNKDYNGYLLCQTHYNRVINTGQPFIKPKERKTNEIKILTDWAEVMLYNYKGEITGLTKIDIEDVEKVSCYRWNSNGIESGYAYCAEIKQLLHKYLVDYEIVDHINRDKLDNRKKNLRPATKSTNAMNINRRSDNKSGFIGVGWLKNKSRWYARVQLSDRALSINNFTNKHDAIVQRLLWEKEHFKEFAPQRHLFAEYGIIEEEADIDEQ